MNIIPYSTVLIYTFRAAFHLFGTLAFSDQQFVKSTSLFQIKIDIANISTQEKVGLTLMLSKLSVAGAVCYRGRAARNGRRFRDVISSNRCQRQ